MKKNNNKFVCPDCGGRLEYWQEYSILYTREINPETGLVSKFRESSEEESETDCKGLRCVDCGKESYANGTSDFENDITGIEKLLDFEE